jgi:hypothetical protein
MRVRNGQTGSQPFGEQRPAELLALERSVER